MSNELKNFLQLAISIPPFLLVIFVLFMTFKRPEIISKTSIEASNDRPHFNSTMQAFLGIFYTLDELEKMKGYQLVYFIGVIGIIGTTIYVAIITILFYILRYFPPFKI